MNCLPVCINLENRRVLVVGGGIAAFEKIELLKRFGADFTVVGESLDERIVDSIADCRLRRWRDEDLDGIWLTYACDEARESNARLKCAANARGILINTPDDPSLCDFLSPAIYRQGAMTVAVSSGGADVRRAIEWRDRVKLLFGDANDRD
ncbi:precorrin-2 dehydrogenase/sirohydrochlorin ferrochelatase family protein [Pelodictyon luteolum]|uniref:precorrin-2 dehydrogenase/sirohydrochlorin ferrochelatase family protein n=1 Tax=Pelodictyon luteolum TaxID=1100 RepID=UPI0002F03EDC|nr:bifunctional precorrin-2 dehydrogenase/sirohydrochlorin ferrochelatase [Pelodictyon luteolum]